MHTFYVILVRVISIGHLMLIAANFAAIPFLIVNCPIYIWAPLITTMSSPLMGGPYCIMNRLENEFRHRAGMELIEDRTAQFLKEVKYIWRKLWAA